MVKGRPGRNGIRQEQVELLISNSQPVRRWLKGKAPSSIYNYARNMIRFVNTTGKTPDGFLAWAKTVEPVDVLDMIDLAAEKQSSGAIRFNLTNEMRSFLHSNGYNNLPKATNSYTLKAWHRGYKKQEIRELLSFLDSNLHKLYVYLAAETGFRARTLLSVRYKHIAEDYEKGVLPVAVRLGPEYYGRAKSSGFTFLGKRSVDLLKKCVEEGLVELKPETPIINRTYTNLFKVLRRASRKAKLDPKIQINHGLRKYFEDALDQSGLDVDKKRLLEGHISDTRAKHYSSREWEDLRPLYSRAYPHIDIDAGDPELEGKIVDWQDEKRELLRRIDRLEEEKKGRSSEMEEFRAELRRIREDMEKRK